MKRSSPKLGWIVVLALVVLGCGGKVVFEEDGDDGQGGEGGTGLQPGVGAGTQDTSSNTGGSGGSGGSGGGGTGKVVGSIVDIKFFGECQPEVGPDPITGSVLMDYRNEDTSPGSLEIASADVLYANPMEGWVFPVALSPTSSGTVTPGQWISVEHSKVETPGDSSFVCSFCGFEGQLTVRFTDGTSASAPFVMMCGL